MDGKSDFLGESITVTIEDDQICLYDEVDDATIYLSPAAFSALIRFAQRAGFPDGE